jgi:hypothetical protein
VPSSGETQSGPRFVAATGIEIIASGPAWCSPLNGVGVLTSKPQDAASLGMLNQNPTWYVFTGGSITVPSAFLSPSKPKNLVKKDRSQRYSDIGVLVVIGIEVALIPRQTKCSWEVGVFRSISEEGTTLHSEQIKRQIWLQSADMDSKGVV